MTAPSRPPGPSRPVVDIADLVKRLAVVARQAAEQAGTDCDAPGCNALTFGARCNQCSRRLCQGHALWILGSGVECWCLYCVVAANPGMFDDGDDDDGDVIDEG